MSFYIFHTNNGGGSSSGFGGLPFKIYQGTPGTGVGLGTWHPFGLTPQELTELFWRKRKMLVQASGVGNDSDYVNGDEEVRGETPDELDLMTTGTFVGFSAEVGNNDLSGNPIGLPFDVAVSLFEFDPVCPVPVEQRCVYTGGLYYPSAVASHGAEGSSQLKLTEPWGYNTGGHNVFMLELSSADHFFGWDPGDGGGPVWNTTNGTQLRDPMVVAKALGLI